MLRAMKQVLLFILLAAGFAAADNPPTIRVCIGRLENHSAYQLPIDKLKKYFLSELSHKQIKGISIAGDDISDEMTQNHCDYLASGEFRGGPSKSGETVDLGSGTVVDDRKHFAMGFIFDLKKNPSEKPGYSHEEVVIDKNPKTCGDDLVYDAAHLIRDYLNKR